MKIEFTLVIALTLMIASCADLAPARTSALIGEWRYVDPIQSCHYVFRKDGTFAGEVTYQGVRVSQFQGRWSVRDQQLRYEYTADLLRRIPAGTKDTDKLLAVSSNHFVIEAADGSKRDYVRVR